jgi:dUTP pyrophosphatase
VPNIHIKRLDTDLPLPQLAHVGDAGLDIYSAIDVVLAPNGGRVLVPAGIAISIPLGYAGFVLPRSGLALNHGISLVNTPGLIDSHYRGEIKVVMVNTDQSRPYHVSRGDRIAQLVIQRVEEVTWTEVEQLDDNDRGGGFGHSGR